MAFRNYRILPVLLVFSLLSLNLGVFFNPEVARAQTRVNNISQDDDQDELDKINDRYKDTGVQFFLLESTEKGLNPPGKEDIFFEEEALLQIPNEEELDKLVSAIKESAETKSNLASPNDSAFAISSVSNHSSVATWYVPGCGLSAYLGGGIFCWNNIYYNYQIDDVARRVQNPSVTGSNITGYNIALSWSHSGGSANQVNSTTVDLYANGVYYLGVNYNGFMIGTSWNGSWYRQVQPPCAIC